MKFPWFRRPQREAELDAEIRNHLDEAIRDRMERGEAPDEARANALREFGNAALVKEVTREMWGWASLERLQQDLRFGLRMLRKNPGFTLIAVLTLALGIGANTAIFSVINTMLWRPLPFVEAERLALVWDDRPIGNWPQMPLSLPNFVDVREQCQSCAAMSAWANDWLNLSGGTAAGAEPEKVQYAVASANLFSVLGVQPMLGRDFLPQEDKPSSTRAIIISHALWQRHFSASPQAIGQTVTLDGQQYEIGGVLPPGFRFASFPKETDIWLPFGLDPQGGQRIYNRNAKTLGVIARLKPGVSLLQAQTEITDISQRLAQQYPEFNRSLKLRMVALNEQVVKNLRPALLVLLGVVAFVLLIACANVANLQLARAQARQKEIAIRAALGAGRFRLVRQLLVENALLAFLGGAAGVLLALLGTALLKNLPFNEPTLMIPYSVSPQQIGIDGRVLGFTVLLSLLTSVVCGLVPALQVSQADVHTSLKESGDRTAGGPSAQRVRGLLVVAEVALAMLLLAGAGLMVKSFLRLQQVNPGFDPENVLTFDIRLPVSKYKENYQVANFYARLLERTAALPGVMTTGAIEFLPLNGVDSFSSIFIEGRPAPPPSERSHAHYRSATTDYFRALGLQLRQGRSFTERDTPDGTRVTLINETMARKYWPGENPIGKRVALDFETMKFFPGRPIAWDIPGGMREVVGVVGDVKYAQLAAEAVPEMYIPATQRPRREMTVVVHTKAEPLSLVSAVRRELAALDPEQPLSNLNTMSQLLATSIARPRFNFLAFSLFAAIALALAAVGIFGVMTYTVSQRTHEIGIRLALGAQAADVFQLIIGQGMRLVLIGIALGLCGALALTRFLQSLLFQVSTTDPLTFAGISLVLSVVAWLACYLPARRASKVSPLTALRHD